MSHDLLKLCENGDNKPAVGTGKRPRKWCRACYVAACSEEFVAFEVVIPHRDLGIDAEDLMIACAKTGEDISAGTVWLDPVETSIGALIYAGFVRPIPAKASKPARATEV